MPKAQELLDELVDSLTGKDLEIVIFSVFYVYRDHPPDEMNEYVREAIRGY